MSKLYNISFNGKKMIKSIVTLAFMILISGCSVIQTNIPSNYQLKEQKEAIFILGSSAGFELRLLQAEIDDGAFFNRVGVPYAQILPQNGYITLAVPKSSGSKKHFGIEGLYYIATPQFRDFLTCGDIKGQFFKFPIDKDEIGYAGEIEWEMVSENELRYTHYYNEEKLKQYIETHYPELVNKKIRRLELETYTNGVRHSCGPINGTIFITI